MLTNAMSRNQALAPIALQRAGILNSIQMGAENDIRGMATGQYNAANRVDPGSLMQSLGMQHGIMGMQQAAFARNQDLDWAKNSAKGDAIAALGTGAADFSASFF
jgi:hypothetical protein